GKCEGEVPAGLLVAGASGVVEDLLVGFVNPRDIPGFVTSVGVSRAKALMWLGATATGGAAPNGGGASSGGRPQRGIRGLRHGRQRPGDTTGRPFGGGAQ
ncbi:MAG: hypothetical protein LBB58_04615, partial [Cellulomonadaceae bacterium]|nr:hypothetical protein [Cellulomonadaceae bacterium]